MRVTFLGGAEGIGASCALLDLDDCRLMIDCGQRLGAARGSDLPDFSLLQDGRPLAAVFLTHSHADHVGALPVLEHSLPDDCAIYATRPTAALARTMLEDSIRINVQHRQGDGDLPLFPPAAARRVLRRFETVRWGKPVRLAGTNVRATWFPAGHILGAAMIEIHDSRSSALFSGDISVADQLSVSGVFAPAIHPDLLVLESTYGNRLHAHRPTQERRIIERVRQCIGSGGSVLFPTFALGRAQEVLLVLGRAMREGSLDPAPIYADGLVRAISKIYARFPDDLAPGCRSLWEQGLDPIFPDDLPIQPVRRGDDREAIANGPPCVVVSSSGMLQGGASQFYARQWIGDEKNLILITGYQDEESPGQALLNLAATPGDKPRYFKLGGVRTRVHCQVESCSLSAHADNAELVALASKLQPKLILPVHGDSAAREALARNLMASCRAKVLLPSDGESYDVEPTVLRADASSPDGRVNPLSVWPPWDPNEPRALDLQRFHAWLASLKPSISWVTLEELGELWKAPEPVASEDWVILREAVYEKAQPFFVPDAKRPYLLRITPPENLEPLTEEPGQIAVEQAAVVLRELFPAASGLSRFGFYPEDGTVQLEFEFPRAAHRRYVQRLGRFAEQTGWTPVLSEATADASLRKLAEDMIGGGANASFSIDHEAGEVSVRVPVADRPDDIDELIEAFRHKTGYSLDLALTGLADVSS